MSTMSFITSMKALSNTKAVVRFEVEPGYSPTYRFDPACFWAGFEADVKRLRKENDIDSREYDTWVKSVVEKQLHVENKPNRDLTPEEEDEFTAFCEHIERLQEQERDRRTAEYHRIAGGSN